MDEVSKGKLEQMQAVDEREIERATVGRGQRIRTIEVFVAGRPKEPQSQEISAVMWKAGSMATERALLSARLAVSDTDLKVGLRTKLRVHLIKKCEIAHPATVAVVPETRAARLRS